LIESKLAFPERLLTIKKLSIPGSNVQHTRVKIDAQFWF
jgi:hypothetical protein